MAAPMAGRGGGGYAAVVATLVDEAHIYCTVDTYNY